MPNGSERRFPSPLRYPGGKGKLANFFKMLFLENGFVGYEYVEPFAGGASVALSLLFEGYTSAIHINDLNRSIFTFWNVALNQTTVLCRMIRDTSVTIEEWRRQVAIQEDPGSSDLELAYSTFFLNRTNRSGILNGGVIGGKEQAGEWTLDARFDKDSLIRRIRKIGSFRERIRVTNLDASQCLGAMVRTPRTFVYVDPPYYGQGHRLYQDWFTRDDHDRLAVQVHRLTSPWAVSYDTAPRVFELYGRSESLTYDLSYSAAEHYTGSEVLFFAGGVCTPGGRPPAKFRAVDVDRVRMRLESQVRISAAEVASV